MCKLWPALSMRLAGRRAFLLQRRLCFVLASVAVSVVIESVTAALAPRFAISKPAFLLLDQSRTLAIACAYLASLPSCSKAPAADVL